jgi:hypothetical protein
MFARKKNRSEISSATKAGKNGNTDPDFSSMKSSQLTAPAKTHNSLLQEPEEHDDFMLRET